MFRDHLKGIVFFCEESMFGVTKCQIPQAGTENNKTMCLRMLRCCVCLFPMISYDFLLFHWWDPVPCSLPVANQVHPVSHHYLCTSSFARTSHQFRATVVPFDMLWMKPKTNYSHICISYVYMCICVWAYAYNPPSNAFGLYYCFISCVCAFQVSSRLVYFQKSLKPSQNIFKNLCETSESYPKNLFRNLTKNFPKTYPDIFQQSSTQPMNLVAKQKRKLSTSVYIPTLRETSMYIWHGYFISMYSASPQFPLNFSSACPRLLPSISSGLSSPSPASPEQLLSFSPASPQLLLSISSASPQLVLDLSSASR